MKKKILSAVLALTMVLSLMPVSALDEPQKFVRGNVPDVITDINVLAEVLGADKPTTGDVTLKSDVTIPGILRINCDANIKLNGHTLTVGGYVRIDNGKAVSFDAYQTSGKIISSHSTATIVAMRGSTVGLISVSVENEGDGYGIMVNPNPTDAEKLNTELTLLGADVTGGIYVHGNLQTEDPSKTPVIRLVRAHVNGGKDDGAGMYLAGTANTSIEDGSEVTGGIGIGIKAGELVISGKSKITGTGTYVGNPEGNGNGINHDGSALEIEDRSGYGGNIKVTIEDGAELVSNEGHAIHEFTSNGGGATAPKITINGGTFESKEVNIKTDQKVKPVISGGTFSSGLDSSLLDEDHIVVEDGNGNSVVLQMSPQTVEQRTRGVEDNDPDADYESAYRDAGLVLGEQAADGSYTLTIDSGKLEAIAAAGRENETHKILENNSNPYQLWFGMEYKAPESVRSRVKNAEVKFGEENVFTEVDLDTADGFYNYIKVYKAGADGSNGAVVGSEGGETAVIKWLGDNGDVLAVTKAVVKIELKRESTKYTVTFNSQGGSTVEAQTVSSGGKVTEPEEPAKEGFTFGGWFLENADTKFDFDTEITENITLYAKWTAVTAAEYTITFNGNEGTVNPATAQTKGGKLESLPTPVRTGYKFEGWYTEADKGTKVTTDTVFKENTTIFAHWTKEGSDNPDDDKPKEYTVTFDSQGGSEVEKKEVKVKSGEKVTKPADPKKEGYTFDGWYTEKDCKTAWHFDKDTVTKDVTLYAKWTETKDPTPGGDDKDKYKIYVRSDIRYGYVEPSVWSAEPGDRVTITVDPYTDYQLSWIEVVRDDTGRGIYLSEDGRRHTFTMPASDVTIDAGFYLQEVYSYLYYQPSELIQPVTQAPAFEPLAWRSSVVMWDIPMNSWAYQPAQWAYQNGYLDTDAGGSFHLTDPVSHQQMWRIMARWLNAPAMDDRALTSWAMQNGAAMGSSAAGAMTRQDVVLYLYKCYFLMGGDVAASGNLSGYSDARLITAIPTRNAWSWAVDKGIISGTADGYLNPGKTVSRGEYAVILMRLCQNLMK